MLRRFALRSSMRFWQACELLTRGMCLTAMGRPASPYRILVADDNVDSADTTTMLLQMSGHEVRTVYGGLQAVEVARTFRPALAILDLNMPVMDGWATANALRLTQGRIALIALTALSQPADFKRSLVAGFDHHLVKPFDAERLRAVVLCLLVRSRR